MIHSMTGFGGASGTLTEGPAAGWSWNWELKSVNGKSLDVKLRVPSLFESKDREMRGLISKALSRGTVYAALTLDRPQSESALRVDEDALKGVMTAITRITKEAGVAPPTADGILSLRGILTLEEEAPSDELISALYGAVSAGLHNAIEQLLDARLQEGAQLSDVLHGQMATIEDLHTAAKAEAGSAQAHHFAQIKAKIAELIDEALPEDRVEQEAVLLAVRSDVREELDRLDGHIVAAKELLSTEGAKGRKLDFLVQEFSREANTLTSKAWSIDMKRIGLDMKLVIDQFREQVQNIE